MEKSQKRKLITSIVLSPINSLLAIVSIYTAILSLEIVYGVNNGLDALAIIIYLPFLLVLLIAHSVLGTISIVKSSKLISDGKCVVISILMIIINALIILGVLVLVAIIFAKGS